MLSPVIGSDGTVYVGGYYNPVFYAIRPDGTTNWTYKGGSGDSAALAPDGSVYITLGTVRALDGTGTGLWTNQVPGNSPAVVGPDGTIYVADQGRALTAISPTGQTKWRSVKYSIPTLPTTPAVSSSGTIYYCVSNSLFAVTPEGTVEWAFPVVPPSDGDLITSPTIGPDGTVYFGVYTTLYAVAGTNGPTTGSWPMFHQNARHTGKVEKPSLQQPKRRGDGGFQFQLQGELGQGYSVLGSTNLNSWTSLTSFVATTVPVDVVDFTATNFPIRFYRASSP
jgi:outer membrane protein assembly factor BamB